MKKKFLIIGISIFFCGVAMLNSDSAKAKGDDLIKFICDNSAGKCVLKCSECGYEIEGKWVTGRASDGMGICPTCGSNKWE